MLSVYFLCTWQRYTKQNYTYVYLAGQVYGKLKIYWPVLNVLMEMCIKFMYTCLVGQGGTAWRK